MAVFRAPLNLGTRHGGGKVIMRPAERATHLQVVGASGRGKSRFLEHLIRQDILNRQGICLIDPHGTLYDAVVRWCSTRRLFETRTIRLIDPTEGSFAFGFNPLADDGLTEPSLRVDAMVNACAQVWGGEDMTKTPLLRKCLRLVFHALLVNQLTLAEALELTRPVDAEGIRGYLTQRIEDPIFRVVWESFNELPPRLLFEQFGSANNRLLEFLASPVIRAIVGQQERTIDLRACMDRGEIVLVNLATRDRLSSENARLLGTLLINELFLRCRSRPEGSRPFYLYIDECYQYLNEDVEKILDQARKFGLHLILSHQRLGQLRKVGEHVYNAVMTGAQSKVVFGGLEKEDAEALAHNIFLGELDLEKIKHTFDRPVVVDHVPVWLESEGESEGASWSDQETNSSGFTTGFDSEGAARGRGESNSAGSGSTYGGSYQNSHGRQQTLRPLLAVMPSQGYSLDELLHLAVVRLVNQPARHAVAKILGQRSLDLLVPEVRDGIAGPERIGRMSQKTIETTPFIRPIDQAIEEIRARRARLVTAAGAPLLNEPPPLTPEDIELG